MIHFQGVYTALVTPFNTDGQIDWPALEALVQRQLEAGVAGLVPMGTTGESPTLSNEEHDLIIEKVTQLCKGQCQVIAGTGSNATAAAIRTTRAAAEAGVDGCLIVNPYYNKPTQQGLYLHFRAIADAVDIPIMLYNIQGRSGVNLETETLLRLISDCPNIVAVKEASGNLEQIQAVITQTPAHFQVLSGDDNLTLDLIKSGGQGVVSVASNLVPGQIVALVNAALAAQKEQIEWQRAEQLHHQLTPLFEVQMIETNPIPIKAAMAMQGQMKEIYRLPLCPLSEAHRQQLHDVLTEMGLLI